MKTLEDFCLELKNDILTEIGEYKNWDIIDYTMKFYGNSGEGGLIILKKNHQEIKRIRQEKFLYFWDTINLLIDRSKINRGTLTIYPDGTYESEFIWDEEAHLENLKQKARLWFTYYFEQAGLRVADKCDQLGLIWDFEVTAIISFTAGKSNPVLFICPSHPALNFKLHLDQLHHYIEGDYTEAFEACSITRVRDAYQASLVVANEETYHLMNEGELKGYFPRWNRATAILKSDKDISFEDVQFEWVEENT